VLCFPAQSPPPAPNDPTSTGVRCDCESPCDIATALDALDMLILLAARDLVAPAPGEAEAPAGGPQSGGRDCNLAVVVHCLALVHGAACRFGGAAQVSKLSEEKLSLSAPSSFAKLTRERPGHDADNQAMRNAEATPSIVFRFPYPPFHSPLRPLRLPPYAVAARPPLTK